MATKSKQKTTEKKVKEPVLETKDVENKKGKAVKQEDIVPIVEEPKEETVSVPVSDYNRLLETLTELIKKQGEDGANANAKIAPSEFIEVISLSPAITNVNTGMGDRNGRNYRFVGFGVSMEIPYSDLVAIVQNHRGAFDRGFLYINDARFVKSQGLSLAMKKILTKEQMEEIIYSKDLKTLDLLGKASSDQRSHIADILVDMINAGKDVDMNKVKRVSEFVGYQIDEKAMRIKEALSPPAKD